MTTLILTQSDIENCVSMRDAVEAVESAFAAHGRGEVQMPAKSYLTIPEVSGDFRAMPAVVGDFAGIKWVNSHPRNPELHGLPTVLGVFVLSEPRTALPLAIMDASLLTALRTGAAAAVGSKYLCRGVPKQLGIVGCGVQSQYLAEAHRVVFPEIAIVGSDQNQAAAQAFASAVNGRAVALEEACRSEIVCTATPTRTPFMQKEWITNDTHINAIGADAPGKNELTLEVLKAAKVYIDDAHQTFSSGEINVAVSAGQFSEADVAGALGDIVAGNIPRPQAGPTVFDSTGLAIQDVALAAAIYTKAKAQGVGKAVDFSA